MSWYSIEMNRLEPKTLRSIERFPSKTNQNGRIVYWQCGCESLEVDNAPTKFHMCDWHSGYDAALEEHLPQEEVSANRSR